MRRVKGGARGPRLFLSEALRRQWIREKSYVQLARRITEAHHAVTGRRPARSRDFVDRRKLKAIVEGRDFVLSLTELQALESYLDPIGEGLSRHPFFIKPSVLEDLAHSEVVVFLIGVRSHRIRLELSLTDFEAVAEIQRQVAGLAPGKVTFDLRPVPLGETAEDAHTVAVELMEDLLTVEGPSIVSVGSPRVNPGTEAVLAAMFDLEPFHSPEVVSQGPPFSLVWPETTPEFESVSTPCRLALAAWCGERGLAVPRRDAWLLRLEEGLVEVDPGGSDPICTAGVLAAQRRAGGQIWLVIAGLSGGGTLGAAKMARRLDRTFPPAEVAPGPALLWTPVEVRAHEDERRLPVVDHVRFLGSPRLWPPPEGEGSHT